MNAINIVTKTTMKIIHDSEDCYIYFHTGRMGVDVIVPFCRYAYGFDVHFVFEILLSLFS